jgi:predicted AAA+ superfamily ATPase
MIVKRSISPAIHENLQEKIILLSGPRQVGKTYLSKNLEKKYQYFNFDLAEHREILREKSWLRDGSLLIFDEIHKMKKWKPWIKGIYDTQKSENRFLLTGSSRMDTFKKSGDSLAGRHLAFRLNPFSLRELRPSNAKQAVLDMMELGPFPEPLLGGSSRKAALWRRSHIDVIIRQDLIQLETVRDLLSIEFLIEALRKRVGQQIVYKGLADELSVSPHTIKKWIDILESFFIIFVVHPHTKNVLDAVKKEPKIYFYDIGQVQAEEGFKLENLVALHLLKRNQFLEDTEGKRLRLGYLRDKRKREIDFVISENGTLSHLIEVKKSDDQFNTNLNYFASRLRPNHALQLVYNLRRPKDFEFYKVRDLTEFLMIDLET